MDAARLRSAQACKDVKDVGKRYLIIFKLIISFFYLPCEFILLSVESKGGGCVQCVLVVYGSISSMTVTAGGHHQHHQDAIQGFYLSFHFC